MQVTINNFKIPIYQLRSDFEGCVYEETVYVNRFGNFGKRKMEALKEANEAKKEGFSFSANAKKRFKRAFNNLSFFCQKRFKRNPVTGNFHEHEASMFTLTVPSNRELEGKWFKAEMIGPFLKYFTRYAITSKGKGVKSFIWKIEKQERGQLHVHIFTDSMVNVVECRRRWVQLLSKHDLLAGQKGDNSVDVTSFNGDRMMLYALKELAKEEQNPVGLSCYTWGCADHLMANYFSFTLQTKHQKIISSNRAVKCIREKTTDFCTFYWTKEKQPLFLLDYKEFANFEDHLKNMGVKIEKPKPVLSEAVRNFIDNENKWLIDLGVITPKSINSPPLDLFSKN